MASRNISTAHPSKWRLVFPYMEFLSTSTNNEKGEDFILYCSEVQLPGLTLDTVIVETPVVDIKSPSARLNVDDLIVTYSVDELFTNYKFIMDWLYYIKDPETFGHTNQFIDASLWSYSNNDNPKVEFRLKNVWPNAIEPISFDKKIDDSEDLENTVTFSLESFRIME